MTVWENGSSEKWYRQTLIPEGKGCISVSKGTPFVDVQGAQINMRIARIFEQRLDSGEEEVADGSRG